MKATWDDANGDIISPADLAAEGVTNQSLPLEASAYEAPLAALQSENGYIEADEVALRPDNPQLDAICAKFVDEHLHDDDEVRFVLEGEGVFDIRSRTDRWMHVRVEPGDLIIVPAGRHHRFFLTETKTIRCVRLFKDAEGWVPRYRAQVA